MAHVVGSAFQAAHQVLSAAFATDWVVSLHGMAGAGASLSNGTTGAIAVCTPAAATASERFVQLEQSPDVRVARQRVVDAFDAVVPSL